MKILPNTISNKLSFVVLLGSAAIALAAIPDSNSQINACYKNRTLALRLTQVAGSCNQNSTAISWDQDGWKGYGYLEVNGTLNAAISKGVYSVNTSPQDPGTHCINTTFSPSLISVTSGDNASPLTGVVIGSEASADTNLNFFCGASTDAMIQGGQMAAYFFLR